MQSQECLALAFDLIKSTQVISQTFRPRPSHVYEEKRTKKDAYIHATSARTDRRLHFDVMDITLIFAINIDYTEIPLECVARDPHPMLKPPHSMYTILMIEPMLDAILYAPKLVRKETGRTTLLNISLRPHLTTTFDSHT